MSVDGFATHFHQGWGERQVALARTQGDSDFRVKLRTGLDGIKQNRAHASVHSGLIARKGGGTQGQFSSFPLKLISFPLVQQCGSPKMKYS